MLISFLLPTFWRAPRVVCVTSAHSNQNQSTRVLLEARKLPLRISRYICINIGISIRYRQATWVYRLHWSARVLCAGWSGAENARASLEAREAFELPASRTSALRLGITIATRVLFRTRQARRRPCPVRPSRPSSAGYVQKQMKRPYSHSLSRLLR